jgi:uncharacterized damage-inducible protein DinB
MNEALIETWQIHDRIHQFLLDGMTDEGLEAALFPKGRTVRDLLAHIHNVRLMWLQSAAPDLLEGLSKLEKGNGADRVALASALEASGVAIANLIGRGDKVKGFKPHTTAFVGYLISHESHHRGQIEWAIRSAGQGLSDKTSYGLWEWGVR